MTASLRGSGPTPLPGVLAEIAEVAGDEAAFRLALALGGKSVYVPGPGHLDGTHRLAAAVGIRAGRAIARRFRGETIEVPMARRALAERLACRGAAPAEISDRLNISLRTARRYARKIPRTMAP